MSVSGPEKNQFRADFSRLAVFSNCFFRSSTRFEMSFNSSFATLLAADTLRALMCASRLALPNAAPTFLPTSVNLFFFAMAFLLSEISSYTRFCRFCLQKIGGMWRERQLTATSGDEYSRRIPFESADSGEFADEKACGGMAGNIPVGERFAGRAGKRCATRGGSC